ncbi:MAG: TauD/TfdA family dioxygenase [Nonomuraea sp.]|nr:TauD/TfdA family dioxygenase [Nonomuraea sp.]
MTIDTTRYAISPAGPFGIRISPRHGRPDPRELPVGELRELTREHHILLLRGFAPLGAAADLERYARSWGEPMAWPFGAVLELVEHEDPKDGVFDANWLPFHWDGMFVDWIPEFQVFTCVDAPRQGEGGRTVFTDTTLVLADLDPGVRELWERTTVTYRISQAEHYGGVVESPLVVPHPDRGHDTVRYQEPVPEGMNYVNPPTLTFDGIPRERVAFVKRSLRDALYDPAHCYAHTWQEGDLVVTDNYTLLHGREAYVKRASRHLRRVHVHGDPPFKNPALCT